MSNGRKSELKALRAVLGRGPTNLLIHLAIIGDEAGRIGPIPAEGIGLRCLPETFRKWRRKLEAAGLLRVTMPPGKKRGYVYEMLGSENLPIGECLDEYIEELSEAQDTEFSLTTKGEAELLHLLLTHVPRFIPEEEMELVTSDYEQTGNPQEHCRMIARGCDKFIAYHSENQHSCVAGKTVEMLIVGMEMLRQTCLYRAGDIDAKGNPTGRSVRRSREMVTA